MKKLTALPAWRALEQHCQTIADSSMQEWFAKDPERFARFSLTFDEILFDFSKNRINQETISLFVKLAEEANLSEAIEKLFSGFPINYTENRPALHTALRDRRSTSLLVNGHNVMADIHATLQKMQVFTDEVRNETWRGATGKPIRDIVNIGMGGSHLGPLMVTHALMHYADPKLRCYFISNIDGSQINEILQKIDPEQTLFIISSKTFTTTETLSNAALVREWLQDKLGSPDISSHFVAVTAAKEKAIKWGIPGSHIFSFWDWVGGRYSVWSAIGLPIALMVGMENFYAFLDGAHEMDLHFKQTEFSKNIPFLSGLLGIWNINFFGCRQQAVIPYAYELNYFQDYIQQLDMESNGKFVTQSNHFVEYATGPVIFGQQGCDGQHSFFQHLHQSPNFTPVDFILAARGEYFEQQQNALIASALSQAQALMSGRSYIDALTELKQAGYSEEEAATLAKNKIIPGNRPSHVFFLKKITPQTLGQLIALYEHKIFVQGIIWNINSFDQWGVELGKKLLPAILVDLENTHSNHGQDSSTIGLINYYRNQT